VNTLNADSPAHSLLAFAAFLRRRAVWIIVPVFAAVVLGTVYYALSRPVYRATVKVIPVDSDRLDSMANDVVGRLGGIVELAGISSLGSSDSRAIAVELLRSRSLASAYIAQQKLTGKVLDCGPEADDVSSSDSCHRATDKALRLFDRRIRRVSEDRRSGIVSLEIDWFEPSEAAAWANGLVTLLNMQSRDRALADAQKNMSYLERQLADTSSLEIKSALYRLMESELKRAMLAEVREEFALKVVDPAVEPGSRDVQHPRLSLTIVGSIAGGLILGFILAVAVDLRELAKAGK